VFPGFGSRELRAVEQGIRPTEFDLGRALHAGAIDAWAVLGFDRKAA
jgi:hypothetical protein